MPNFSLETLKNPFVAGILAAIVAIIFKLVDNKVNQKEEGALEYIKYAALNAATVCFMLFFTSSKTPKEEILTSPFFDN